MTTTITARASVAGLHHWPDAPPRRAYLRHPHRHLFALRAVVEVDHSNRAVEFHDLSDHLLGAMMSLGTDYHADALLKDFGPRSCEVLASAVAGLLGEAGYSVVSVTVSEDNESDGTWTR